MNLKAVEWDGVDWINQTQVRSRLLWTSWWIFRFHEIWGIYWL